jgi:signal transduction histidine kinase
MPMDSRMTATPGSAGAIAADGGERRRLHVDPHVGDALLALAFTAGALVSLLVRGAPAAGFKEDDALSIVLVLLTTLPLALLHVQPLAAYAVMLGGVVATTALSYEGSYVSTAALALALFMIAVTASYRTSVTAGVSTGLLSIAAVVILLLRGGDLNVGQMVFYWLAFTALWLVGLIIKLYRESAARATRRAALFAQDRELRAHEAVAEERARLARELHDGVGHALNVVVLHAQGAQRVMESKPQLAREALTAIETAARQALADVERMLGVLRSEEDDVLAAQPGLAQIDVLAAQVTEAGLPVSVHIEGQPAPLPASLDLTAYRIAQESLTNSLKHAGNARAAVVVRYLDGAVEIEVIDTGRGAAAAPSETGGHGIPGMRERVTVFGGRLQFGPRPEGGFRVLAWLPLTAGTVGGDQ